MIQELSEREHSILNRLMVQGAVSVADLSSELAVSEVTIRSDLSSLEERGLLSRTHGGALPSIHPHIFQRQNMNIEEKHRIAKAAADLVEDGDAIMIEAGTTTSLLPRYLAGKRDILIITNSIPAFESAKSNPALKITLVGGEFRDSTDSFVGRITLDTIRRFNVRCAFVGTDGFSLKSGITTHLIEGGYARTRGKSRTFGGFVKIRKNGRRNDFALVANKYADYRHGLARCGKRRIKPNSPAHYCVLRVNGNRRSDKKRRLK